MRKGVCEILKSKLKRKTLVVKPAGQKLSEKAL